jgi:hypothetical protein
MKWRGRWASVRGTGGHRFVGLASLFESPIPGKVRLKNAICSSFLSFIESYYRS